MGGTLRPYLDGPELAWSPDGTRMVYHTSADGDPIFVTEPDEEDWKADLCGRALEFIAIFLCGRQTARSFILFEGFPPDEMDIWRIRPTGGSPERITFHNSRVAYPTFLNQRTLLYTSRDADGSGPWLYGIDVERRVPHRISFGVEQYTSIAATLKAGGWWPQWRIRMPIFGECQFRKESSMSPRASRITLPAVSRPFSADWAELHAVPLVKGRR